MFNIYTKVKEDDVYKPTERKVQSSGSCDISAQENNGKMKVSHSSRVATIGLLSTGFCASLLKQFHTVSQDQDDTAILVFNKKLLLLSSHLAPSWADILLFNGLQVKVLLCCVFAADLPEVSLSSY